MEVIVAGAGPVGLMLAAELRLGGVDVEVLERLPEPAGQSRGAGVHARTIETLDQRGILDRFAGFPSRTAWHFGALPVPLDLSQLDSPHAVLLAVPQARTEGILGAWAEELGAVIRRGHQVVGLDQDPDGVEVQVQADAETYRLRAAYVVGCDGGHSLVRSAAGFDFSGRDATTEVLLADMEGLDLEPRPFTWTPLGLFAVLPLGPGWTRVFAHEHEARPAADSSPPTFDDVRAVFRRVSGQELGSGRPLWISRFDDRAGQASRYRIGRVLLAGDAAHLHPPAGGQGLNLGIQDAVNLGWKLAAEVNGWAPAGLLDTYHAERHPVGDQVLVNTQVQSRMMLGGPSEAGPLRSLFGELLRLEDVNRYLAGIVSGVDIRYDVGGGDHPLLGRRLRHRELVTGEGRTSTTRLLRSGRGVLLDLADDPGLRAAARPWTDRLDLVPAPGAGDGELSGIDAVLMRPDGYVAGVAPGSEPLELALRRWLGEPG